MFNWLKKRFLPQTGANRIEDPQAPANRIEALADRLAREGKAANIEGELEALDVAELSSPELEAWYHLRGIAAFRRGDRQLAKARFAEAHSKFPSSAMIAFSLGQEYEYIGDTATMFGLFDRYRFPALPAIHALAESRYAYLWGDIDRAVSYVEPVLEMHFKLGFADDMFLHTRGMPFFGQTWAYLAAFYELRRDLSTLETITERAASGLKDYDVSTQRRFLESLRTGDFSQYTATPNYGTGSERARAAVILTQHSTTLDGANSFLDAVQFSTSDFPWLSDIILLARCEAAHRLDPAVEPALIDSFFARQPLLFEPDHAVNFRVLAYQEYLKQLYQSRRRLQPA
jgi:hypothetical protein